MDSLSRRIMDSRKTWSSSTPSLDFYFPVVGSSCTRHVLIRNVASTHYTRYLNCASSNYLNLSVRQEVVEAGRKALELYGSGANGAPVLSGRYEVHEALEEAIARFHGAERAALFPSGYVANLGVISAICSSGDLVAVDTLAHASIVDGARLSRARLYAYSHNRVESLPSRVSQVDEKSVVLVATETVFSMDADLCPLPDFVKLKRAKHFRLLLDDAHAVGVFGCNGRGGVEHFGLKERDVCLHVGTFSKTFASIGGYVVGRGEVIEYLRFAARSSLFSANIPPAMAACSLAAVGILQQEGSELSSALRRLARCFREELSRRGIEACGHPEAPIVPIIFTDEDKLVRVARRLGASGIFMNVVQFPAVPRGKSRLRFVLNLGLTEDDVVSIATQLQKACDTKEGAH